ncbi:MAG: hypothetical protein ACOZAL_01080 [Patescibacteria group bacterium]
MFDQTHTATCPDSQTLFYTAHVYGVATSSNTYRNQIRLIDEAQQNPKISRAAIIDAYVDAKNYKDVNSTNRPITLDTLVVSPKNYDWALRCIESPGVVGSPNVDINPLRGWIKKVVMWEKLSADSAGTDKSNYWFAYDSKKVGDSLKALFARKPKLYPPDVVYKTGNWEYKIDFYYMIARCFPAYIRGSNATEA